MKTDEFYGAVAEQAGMTKKDVEKAIKAYHETLKNVIAKDDTVTFVGFGKWCLSKRSARNGRNPQTGKAISIPPSTGLKFSSKVKF